MSTYDNEDGPKRPEFLPGHYVNSLGLGTDSKSVEHSQKPAELRQNEAHSNYDRNFDDLSSNKSFEEYDLSSIDKFSQGDAMEQSIEHDYSSIDALSSDNKNEQLISDYSNWKGQEVDNTPKRQETSVNETGHPNEDHILPDMYSVSLR